MIALQFEFDGSTDYISRLETDFPSSTVELQQGYWKLDIDSKYDIRYTDTGLVRFTSQNNHVDIEQFYSDASTIITEIFGCGAYSEQISLIIRSEDDPLDVYLDMQDHIEEFRNEVLKTSASKYNEIGDTSIQISFGVGREKTPISA